jgi:AhpD family alkylhydroperoxidase
MWDDLPLLPGILQCMAEEIASGAVERNRESCEQWLTADDAVEPGMLDVCFDPQTSGGLLLAVPHSVADDLLKKLHAEGMPDAAMIGKVLPTKTGRVFLHTDGSWRKRDRDIETLKPSVSADKEQSLESGEISCCEEDYDEGSKAPGTAGDNTAAERKFKEFLQASGADGTLDGKAKQAVAIALSVLSQCEPCVKMHVKKARAMGFSQEEIDEAVWMAISFGGSPVMMFYNALK